MTEALKALSAKWRKNGKRLRRVFKQTGDARYDTYSECADELDAALAQLDMSQTHRDRQWDAWIARGGLSAEEGET